MERVNKQKTFNFLNRKNKWLGIIDYKTIVALLSYTFIIFEIVNYFRIELIYKLYIIIILVFPCIIFILLNLSEECIVDKLIIIIKFLLKRKKYVNMIFYAKNDTIYVENVDKHHIVKSKK